MASCHSILGEHIHRIYRIEPSFSVSSIQGIMEILQVVPSSSSSSLLSSFDESAKLLHCCNWQGCSSCGISSLTTVPNGIFFPFLFSPQIFLPYFAVRNLWVSCSLRHLHFLGEVVLESSLNISSRFNG